MNLLPKPVLQDLICSNCKKYLSVPPIKVYHNRQVKCGRCNEEEDGGTISILYNIILGNAKFPCIHQVEGCRELFTMIKMKNHENKCHSKQYACPICPNYEDISYNLVLHIKDKHRKMLLENRDFFMSLDSLNNCPRGKVIYFYYNQDVLLNIEVGFDDGSLKLHTQIVGDDRRAVAKYSFYSVENELLFETRQIRCSEWGATGRDFIEVRLNKLKCLPSVVFCRFQIIESTKLPIADPLSIIKLGASSAELICEFKNISTIRTNQQVYAEPIYYVKDLKWRVWVRKCEYAGKNYLDCFLQLCEAGNKRVFATIEMSLLCNEYSGYVKDIVLGPRARRFIPEIQSWGCIKVIAWDNLLDIKNNYVENDSIRLRVFVKVISVYTL